MNQLISDGGDCRTAQATPGLLITDDIRTKLDIEEPDELLGEEILKQFRSQFENMNKGGQHRVLTSIPV